MKKTSKISLAYCLFFYFVPILCTSSIQNFQNQWHKMQNIHQKLEKGFSKTDEEKYVSVMWRSYRADIKNFLSGKPSVNFLAFPAIQETMVRAGFKQPQMYEVNYLKHFLTKKNTDLISKYKDSAVGGISLDCKEFNCSVNTLGQLFYMGKILEQNDASEINTILEFGGGYGCLCTISKTILPNTTYIIVDLPELLALQYLYLKLVNDSHDIVVHYNDDFTIEKGKINLVPANKFQKITIKPDIFVSNFALSECPLLVQKMVIDNNFFNASCVYVTGQVDGWKTIKAFQNSFAHHDSVISSIKKQYNKSYVAPHHIMANNLCSYEVIAHA